MSTNVRSLAPESLRGDALSVHIPSPHLFRDDRNPSIRTEPTHPRPLPRPPQPADAASASARPVPRRRASGGCFVHIAPPARKTTGFYVCNPSDSPISPDSPNFLTSPLLHLGINVVPATPLPPYTPGLHYSHTNLAPEKLDSPTPDASSVETHPRLSTNSKMHRRFGRSVGSIPASALAELRSMGERNRHSRPIQVAESDDSDSSSDEEDNEEHDEETYSWVVEKAIRVTRPSLRESLEWAEELGGDRWIVDRYSSILRAL
ncbi:hypothetical protein B0H19DRAFT_1169379 [Mycena capillaripes]|nr:hypothetical protein B0H19DRAFT_1169379 [Mycena capillaripes]